MLVSIAVVSFLIGTMFNAITVAKKDGGNPLDEIWEAIYDLQTQVGELEEGQPQVITVTGHPQPWHRLEPTGWTDLLSIPNVTISENTTVFAIATACFTTSHMHVYAMQMRHRANTSYGRHHSQGWDTTGSYRETLEIHHVWSNLTAGTYTFAFQCGVNVSEMYVKHSRLTLVIF
jgi:hypothetical protein